MSQIRTSFDIAMRALWSVMRHPLRTLRVIAFPAMPLVLGLYVMARSEDFRSRMSSDLNEIFDAQLNVFLVYITGFAIFLVGSGLLAIFWHRFALGHAMFRARIGNYLRYALRATAIFLVVALIMMLPAWLEWVAYEVGPVWLRHVADHEPLLFAFSLVLALYLMTRLSPSLPAAAVGDRLGLFGAWQATRPLRGVCLILGCLQIAAFLPREAVLLLVPDHWLLDGALAVFETLICVAINTELYRHLRPSRP